MAYIRVDLDEFDTDDMIKELEYRGYVTFNKQEVPESATIDLDGIVESLNEIYLDKRIGKDYTSKLDDLIYKVLGRM